MSERFTSPGAYQAQMELERAEAIVNAFCNLYDRLVALFNRDVPAALAR